MTKPSDGAWYYQQTCLGWNYRITDLQAALGASQMSRLDAFIARRHEIALRYEELLSGVDVVLPVRSQSAHSALHLYVVRVPKSDKTASHAQVFDRLRASGIGVNLHYIPVHMQPYYQDLGFEHGMFPQAEAYYEEAISLPMFPDLTDAAQEKVAAALRAALIP
jgi:dTDP-4-amino-4,6-dideoxygalactose transaminase